MTGKVFGPGTSTAYSVASKKSLVLHCRRRIVVDRIASRAPARPIDERLQKRMKVATIGLRPFGEIAERGKFIHRLALRFIRSGWTERYGEECLRCIDDLKLDGRSESAIAVGLFARRDEITFSSRGCRTPSVCSRHEFERRRPSTLRG